MSIIIICLGNPVLTDDSLGMHAAREIASRLIWRTDVEVCEIYAGGLDLMEAMVGHERAIIIDAACTGQMDPGTVFSTHPAALQQSRNTGSNHNSSIEVALELGKLAGLALPRDIRIWAIEAADVTTFSENLTDSVRRALPGLINNVLRDIDYDSSAFPEARL
jgi:hydrogenase maturation protease